MSRRAAPSAPVPFTVALTGGLDLVTPPVEMPPGRAIAAVNYEPVSNGYGRIDGLERLDGQPAPSAASYSTIPFATGLAAITAGQTVTGGTSAATGYALVDAVVSSGSYGASNAVGYIVIVPLTGAFISGEALKVAGVTKSTSTAVATDRGAASDDLDAQYLAAAVLRARNLIGPVPGEGPVRGAIYAIGAVYAFRNNVGSTKCPMWKATATGWVSVPLGWSVSGTASGATAIAAGNTITGATSGATAMVSRVITDGGQPWAAAMKVRLILSAITGTFVNGENIQVGGVTRAAAVGGSSDNTPPPGGRYEFDYENFYGASTQKALYGANGVGPAFEFDGTIFSPIITGAPLETPSHLAVNHLRLFLSFPNGQLQGSQAGLPQGWNGTFGATAFGFGDDITGLLAEVAGAMAVFGATKIKILTGSSAADFVLGDFTSDVGAVEWTVQTMNTPVFMDRGGVRNLTATQAFGNFKVGALTQLVAPLLKAKKDAGITPVASIRVRDKAHYRLYWSDGTGICIFIGGKGSPILPFDYGTRIPRCTWSGPGPGGEEMLLMGCDDGYVYQLDKGTSMDGGTINGFLRPAFNHCGSPGYNKKFHTLNFQVNTSPVASLFMTAAFSDGDPDMPAVDEQSFTVYGGGGFWNENAWNKFLWSSRFIGKAVADCPGLGNNISPTVGTSSAVENPHILSSYTVTFTVKGPVKA